MSEFRKLSPVTTYQITLADGKTIETTTSLADTLAFERENKRPLMSSIGQPPLTTDLLWLAWHAACRESKTELRQFAQFSTRVTDFASKPMERDYEYSDSYEDEQIAEVIGETPTRADQPAG